MAVIAMKNGAKLTETPGSENVTVVTDPFGSHCSFVTPDPAVSPSLSSNQLRYNGKPWH